MTPKPASRPHDAPGVLRHLLEPDNLADPYPLYDELHDRAGGTDRGNLLITHDEVTTVLGDRRFSSDRVPALFAGLDDRVRDETADAFSTLRSIIAFADPPAHTRLRRLMQRAFSPGVVRREREAVERAVAHLLDALPATDVVDLHNDVTYPLPAMVVGALLGIPDDDLARFQGWALDIVNLVGSGRPSETLARRLQDDVLEMRELLGRLVADRRQCPTDDLLTTMVTASDGDDQLTLDEVFANALFLMTAGHETATNMLSNGLICLLRHPDQLAHLRTEPELIESATEEMLRFESPVQMTARVATDDVELDGRTVPAGTSLVALLGAANRDPTQFDDPHRFDITRSPNRHVAFAHGPHFCLGASLARLEMQVAIPRILERFPTMRLRDTPIEWQPTLNFRGPLRLEVQR